MGGKGSYMSVTCRCDWLDDATTSRSAAWSLHGRVSQRRRGSEGGWGGVGRGRGKKEKKREKPFDATCEYKLHGRHGIMSISLPASHTERSMWDHMFHHLSLLHEIKRAFPFFFLLRRPPSLPHLGVQEFRDTRLILLLVAIIPPPFVITLSPPPPFASLESSNE